MIIKNGKTISARYKGTKEIIKRYKGTLVVYEAFKNLLASGVPPLTLMKCKGVDLVDYKIYGNSVQGKLPSEYQQVEYIECTGTQYIDTLINPANKKIGAILDFQFTSTDKSTGGVIGSFKTDGQDNIQFTKFQSKWRIKINSYGAYGSNHDTLRHTVRLNMPDGTKIDDTLVTDTQYTVASTNTANLYLCACNYDISNETSIYSLIGKLYSAKIYDDTTLIRDYVPCYEISSGKIGLYDLVENKFYTNIGTGTFSKGSDTPTPDTPIEVESVGDKTSNIADLSKVKASSGSSNCTFNYNNLTGTLELTSTPGVYDYTTISAQNLGLEIGKTYYYGGDIIVSGKTTSDRTSIVLELGGNGYYSIGITKNTTIHIQKTFTYTGTEQGNVALRLYFNYGSEEPAHVKFENVYVSEVKNEFEPYGYKIPVKVSGKNLFNPTLNFTEYNNYGLSIKYLKDEDCFLINGTSTASRNHAERYINLPITKGEKYIVSTEYISGTVKRPDVTNNWATAFFGASDTINTSNNWQDTNLQEYNTATSYRDKTCNYNYITRFWFYAIPGVSFDNYKIRIQLEKGDIATVYEPYVEPVTKHIYLDEPLRKIGDCVDYIDFENGKVVRNIKEYVLNGTETITSYSTNTENKYRMFVNVPNAKGIASNIIGALSSHYIGMSANKIYTCNTGISSHGAPSFVVIYDENYQTTDSLKSFLQEQYSNSTPLKVIYLREPKEETIELPNIPTFKGTTILEVDTNIQPSNMEVVYKGKEVK